MAGKIAMWESTSACHNFISRCNTCLVIDTNIHNRCNLTTTQSSSLLCLAKAIPHIQACICCGLLVHFLKHVSISISTSLSCKCHCECALGLVVGVLVQLLEGLD